MQELKYKKFLNARYFQIKEIFKYKKFSNAKIYIYFLLNLAVIIAGKNDPIAFHWNVS